MLTAGRGPAKGCSALVNIDAEPSVETGSVYGVFDLIRQVVLNGRFLEKPCH